MKNVATSKLPPKIAVAIVEDHHLIRDALAMLLARRSDIVIVGTAADGNAALTMINRSRPQVVVLDLVLPRLHGLELLPQIPKPTKVIALSVRSDDVYVVEALRKGAAGYVLKESTSDELMGAIDAVIHGERYLSRSLRRQSIDRLLATPRKARQDPLGTLTTREQLVFQCAADGMSVAEIANHLYISQRTAEFHRSNVMRKLGCRSQTDLVKLAIRKGITTA